MNKWWQLYKTDWRNSNFFYLVISLLVVGWYLFLGLQTWPEFIVLGLSCLPFFLLPGVIFWLGFQSFRKEWKQKTIYSLLSLPRAGWEIASIKLLTGLSFYLGLTLVAGGLLLVVNWEFIRELGQQLPNTGSNSWIISDLIKMTVIYWLISAGLYITSQFSYLVSRIYSRWRGVISIVVFLLTQYLVIRGGSLLAVLFGWVPKMSLEGQVITPEMMAQQTIQLNLAPIVGSVVMLGLVFGLSSWLLETQLEI